MGHAEAAQALELVPAVAAHAEETQHPPVAPAAELADAAALRIMVGAAECRFRLSGRKH